MSQSSLTAKYRPQRFDQVAGQQTVRDILSRAALEDRVAPAYLFSGTRGVGKTTIARIMAKALNCETAPTGEPCNQCLNCRQITQGAAVDVVEIDGASNRGIDDARRLKEDIGYAPMQCRYKVFIIDEAHMLTKEAFNALLKTLEEPPGNVTFILATTEPHKFPATIISRCQHYAFKRLTTGELTAHLTNVLQAEGKGYDGAAVGLIARRAAGSVRDAMSLMGQVLALGRDRLEAGDVRDVLGLAGQEVFFRVMEAIRDQDCVAVRTLLMELMDQGVDIGFFLRELTAVWRNLFLLSQSGERALPVLEIPEEEGRQWLDWAPQFSLARIHACWQLTLEGQRRVLTSLEPALALELLLLNLTFLPRLLPLESLSAGTVAQAQGAPVGQGGQGGSSAPSGAAPQGAAPGGTPGAPSGPGPGPQAAPPRQAAPRPQQPAQSYNAPRQSAPQAPPRPANMGRSPGQSSGNAGHAGHGMPGEPPGLMDGPPDQGDPPGPAAGPASGPEYGPEYGPAPDPLPGSAQRPAAPASAPAASPSVPQAHANLPRTWEAFVSMNETLREERPDDHVSGLRNVDAKVEADRITLRCRHAFQCEQLSGENGQRLARLAHSFFGPGVAIDFAEPELKGTNMRAVRDEAHNHPVVKALQKEFGAQVASFGPLDSVSGANGGNGA